MKTPTLPTPANSTVSGLWSHPAVIAKTSFQSKSLSGWSFNPAIGCAHACRFCYVPSVSTNHLASQLAPLGVGDPDSDWGRYIFLRPWDEAAFMKSLRHADFVSRRDSAAGTTHAVMFSSTTDPYQVIPNANLARSRELTDANLTMVARALELIRDHSTLNVRILTRSPLAAKHFELFRSFGPRLLFGMSMPTLRNDLASIYEPKAPAPSRRLATLQKARDAGLHVYVAMGPTYPECNAADIHATMQAVAALNPCIIYHEPINVRAENIARIEAEGLKQGVPVNTAVFASPKAWGAYALESFRHALNAAKALGVQDRLHLSPDKALGHPDIVNAQKDPAAYLRWLNQCWSRVSAWPVGTV